MDEAKRTRGRPRGSGVSDRPYLERIAALIVADPSLKPRAAMCRILHQQKEWVPSEDSVLRRWQRKWKIQGSVLVKAAQDQRKRRDDEKRISEPFDWLAPNVGRLIADLPGSRWARQVRDALPYLKELRMLDDDRRKLFAIPPGLLQELTRVNSIIGYTPAIREALRSNDIMRKMQPSLAMQALIDHHNSPFVEAIQASLKKRL